MPALAIQVQVQGDRLVPVAEYDRDILTKWGEGTIITLSGRRGRSLPHHRLYWATLERLVRDTPVGERYASKEMLHDALLMATGNVRTIWHPGEQCNVYVPASTSFAAMDQVQFGEYTAAAWKLVAEAFGVDVEKVVDWSHGYVAA